MTVVNRDSCGLSADSEPAWLTYAEAARRVKSSKHTVQVWRREGMPMEWRVDEGGRRFRVVELQTLLSWWRRKMQNSPVHFYRMRRKAIERGETPPPIPKRFRRPLSADLNGTEHPDGSEPLEGAEPPSSAILAVIAELPMFVGQAEHAALMAAMEQEAPGCDGLDVFTADRYDDPKQTEMMRGVCRACPLLELCTAFAIAGRPTAGMWAGMTPAEVRRIPERLRTESAPSAA